MDSFVFFAVAYLLAAGAPGTDTMLIVSRTIVGGKSSAIRYAIGIALAKTTMVSLAFFGAGSLLSANPNFMLGLKWLGAAFLIFMAARLLFCKSKPATTAMRGTAASVLGGYIVGVSNPQPLMFYSSIVPTVVADGLTGWGDLFVLWLIVILGFALITVFYMAIAQVANRWLGRPENRILVNRIMAAVFVVIAIVIVTR
jgi:threonine/homoserine/homoserine lactone efflux protein